MLEIATEPDGPSPADPSPSGPVRTGHDDRVGGAALDGVRGLAAQVVLAAHAAAILAPGSPPRLLASLGWGARAAVVVFFVLSGFVIGLAIIRALRSDHGFRPDAYAGHRAARILPPYVAAVALTAGIGWALSAFGAAPAALKGLDLAPGLAEIARALSFTYRTGDPHNLLNGPIWSLRIEVGLYLVIGLVGAGIARKRWLRAFVLALAVLVALALALRLVFGFAALLIFATGAAAALRATYGPRPARWALPLLALALLVPLWLPPALLDRLLEPAPGAQALLLHLVVGYLCAAVILDLSSRPSGVGDALAQAAPLGRFAYTLYVVHAPLLFLAAGLREAFTPDWPVVLVALAACLAIEAISLALARVLERPAWFRRFGARWLSPPR